MKKFSIIPLAAVLMLFFTACEDDPVVGPGTEDGPSVFLSNTGQISSDAEISPNTTFSVIFSASAGDNDLESMVVKEDGVAVSFSRLTFNGDAASVNPVLLFSPDTEGFTWEIGVEANNASGDVNTYSFEVADDAGNTGVASVTLTTVGLPPSLTVVGSGNYETTPNVAACINLEVTSSQANLASIELLERDTDGINVTVSDLSSIYYGDLMTNFASNPFEIPEEDSLGFSKPIYIRPDYAGVGYYTLVITDDNGTSASAEFTVSSGTSISMEIMGSLLNSAGPTGTGGLDLDTGNGVGSSDASADIRDAGIDIDAPSDDLNWIQRIGGVNGTEIRKVNDVLAGVEGVSFETINYVEFISAFYDAAPDFTFSDSKGLLSDVVAEGDIFIVRSTDIDYLIRIAQVTVTPSDNSDNYLIDIKY